MTPTISRLYSVPMVAGLLVAMMVRARKLVGRELTDDDRKRYLIPERK